METTPWDFNGKNAHLGGIQSRIVQKFHLKSKKTDQKRQFFHQLEEISRLREQISHKRQAIEQLEWQKSTFDIVSPDQIGSKLEQLAKYQRFLDLILRNKDVILSRLQTTFSSQNVHLHYQHQQDFMQLFEELSKLTPILEDLLFRDGDKQKPLLSEENLQDVQVTLPSITAQYHFFFDQMKKFRALLDEMIVND